MDARTTARLIGAGRALFGLLCLFFPKAVTGPNRDQATPLALGWIRLFGIRDLVLGAGALASVNDHHRDTSWVRMGAIADTADAITVVAARRQVGTPFTLATLSLAVPAAALGWKSVRGLAHS